MITIVDDMIETAYKLFQWVYRSYPTVRNILNVGIPCAVITPMARAVILTDDRGGELIVQEAYAVDIFASSPAEVDDLHNRLTNLYNAKGIQSTGYTPTYSVDTEAYCATATYIATVDKRGDTYR